MRSTGIKSSENHDLRLVFTENVWICLLLLLAFGLLVPFSTAGLSGDSIFNIDVTHEQMKFRLLHENAAAAACVAAALGGLLCGAVLFRFQQSRSETTILLSLPLTRRRIFAHRFLTGLVYLCLGIGLPMLASVGLNLWALGDYRGLKASGAYLFLGLLLTAAVSYAAAVLVSAFSGSVREVLLYWTVGMASPVLVQFGLNRLADVLYFGSAWGKCAYNSTEEIAPSLMEQGSGANPVFFFYEELKEHASYFRALSDTEPGSFHPQALLAWLPVFLMLVLAGLYFLRRRKAEYAGQCGLGRAFPILLNLFTGFGAAGAVFSFFFSYHVLLAAAFALLAALALFLFWGKMLCLTPTHRRGRLLGFAGELVCLLAACLYFQSGCLHQVQRYEEKTEIREISVSYVGSPQYLYVPAEGSSTGEGYYLTGELTFQEEASIQAAEKIHRDFDAQGWRELAVDEDDFSDTVVAYDVIFRCTEASGRERVWYYDRASMEQLTALLELEEGGEASAAQEALLSGTLATDGGTAVWAEEAYKNGEVFLTDRYCGEAWQLELTEEEREELRGAIAEDYAKKGLSGRYFPDGETEAILMFSLNGESDCETFAYDLNNSILYLTKEDTATCAWLEQKGWLELVEDAPEIESVILQKFDPYLGMKGKTELFGMYFMEYLANTSDAFLVQKDFGTRYEITDPDQIAGIEAGLRSGYYMSGGGWLAAVKRKGLEGYCYMFLPEEYVPDGIRG